MAKLERHGPAEWVGYHDIAAVRQWVPDQLMMKDDAGALTTPSAYFAESARVAKQALKIAVDQGTDIRPLGAGWSMNEILRTDGPILGTMDLMKGIFRVADADAQSPPNPSDGQLVLVAAGVRIGDLNAWLEHEGLSMWTTGAHNGQSVAGVIATGAHGSVPSKGGVHCHVRGLQIVVETDKSVWLQAESGSRLNQSFASGFCDEFKEDSELFNAATVHLGGMGIVTAVLLEVAPLFIVEVIQKKCAFTSDWVADIESGNFLSIARRVDEDFSEVPYYCQIIINPFNPFTSKSLVRLYFKRDFIGQRLTPPSLLKLPGEPLNLIKLFTEIAPDLRGPIITLAMIGLFEEVPRSLVPVADEAAEAATRLIQQLPPLFQRWIPSMLAPSAIAQQVEGLPRYQSWGQTSPDHFHYGDIYSVAIAIDRQSLSEALPIMIEAFNEENSIVDGRGGDLVFTLRFVKGTQATMEFTRWEDNIVIDLDGIQSAASDKAAKRVLAALEASGIPYALHWGKMGEITAEKVAKDYGDKADRWKAARRNLLSDRMQALFKNTALSNWGLV